MGWRSLLCHRWQCMRIGLRFFLCPARFFYLLPLYEFCCSPFFSQYLHVNSTVTLPILSPLPRSLNAPCWHQDQVLFLAGNCEVPAVINCSIKILTIECTDISETICVHTNTRGLLQNYCNALPVRRVIGQLDDVSNNNGTLDLNVIPGIDIHLKLVWWLKFVRRWPFSYTNLFSSVCIDTNGTACYCHTIDSHSYKYIWKQSCAFNKHTTRCEVSLFLPLHPKKAGSMPNFWWCMNELIYIYIYIFFIQHVPILQTTVVYI